MSQYHIIQSAYLRIPVYNYTTRISYTQNRKYSLPEAVLLNCLNNPMMTNGGFTLRELINHTKIPLSLYLNAYNNLLKNQALESQLDQISLDTDLRHLNLLPKGRQIITEKIVNSTELYSTETWNYDPYGQQLARGYFITNAYAQETDNQLRIITLKQSEASEETPETTRQLREQIWDKFLSYNKHDLQVYLRDIEFLENKLAYRTLQISLVKDHHHQLSLQLNDREFNDPHVQTMLDNLDTVYAYHKIVRPMLPHALTTSMHTYSIAELEQIDEFRFPQNRLPVALELNYDYSKGSAQLQEIKFHQGTTLVIDKSQPEVLANLASSPLCKHLTARLHERGAIIIYGDSDSLYFGNEGLLKSYYRSPEYPVEIPIVTYLKLDPELISSSVKFLHQQFADVQAPDFIHYARLLAFFARYAQVTQHLSIDIAWLRKFEHACQTGKVSLNKKDWIAQLPPITASTRNAYTKAYGNIIALTASSLESSYLAQLLQEIVLNSLAKREVKGFFDGLSGEFRGLFELLKKGLNAKVLTHLLEQRGQAQALQDQLIQEYLLSFYDEVCTLSQSLFTSQLYAQSSQLSPQLQLLLQLAQADATLLSSYRSRFATNAELELYLLEQKYPLQRGQQLTLVLDTSFIMTDTCLADLKHLQELYNPQVIIPDTVNIELEGLKQDSESNFAAQRAISYIFKQIETNDNWRFTQIQRYDNAQERDYYIRDLGGELPNPKRSANDLRIIHLYLYLASQMDNVVMLTRDNSMHNIIKSNSPTAIVTSNPREFIVFLEQQ